MHADSSRQTGRSPAIATALSLIAPGLGQLYNGEQAKGVAILCITLATWCGIAFSIIGPAAARSQVTVFCLGLTYVFALIPSIIDAYQRASGKPTPLLSNLTAWYVVLMLVSVGPMALPLLWQSQAFSRTAKVVWTAAVIVIAALFIGMLVVVGPRVEQMFQQYPGFLKSAR